MEFKKIFFPIGGGEELRERISGAILIAKYFNSHMEVWTRNVYRRSKYSFEYS